MQEAQVLHLAYAISDDGNWLTAAWTDHTGRHQHSSSFSLRGQTSESIVNVLTERTVSLMPDSANWRLIVARVGYRTKTEHSHWTRLAAVNVAVSVVDVDAAPSLHVYPPSETYPETAQQTTPALPGGLSLIHI